MLDKFWPCFVPDMKVHSRMGRGMPVEGELLVPNNASHRDSWSSRTCKLPKQVLSLGKVVFLFFWEGGVWLSVFAVP